MSDYQCFFAAVFFLVASAAVCLAAGVYAHLAVWLFEFGWGSV